VGLTGALVAKTGTRGPKLLSAWPLGRLGGRLASTSVSRNRNWTRFGCRFSEASHWVTKPGLNRWRDGTTLNAPCVLEADYKFVFQRIEANCCRFSSRFDDYIDSRGKATISDGLKRLFNVCAEFRVIPLGIKAFVDFAFKKIFGSPENSAALIGLLNAILELEHPITEVTILNPYNIQEFQTAKLVVLDVKARDSSGRLFNIEMQISVHPGLLPRMVYYASETYTDQLSAGDDYTKLNTTISICLLTGHLFPDSDQVHHRFQMMDEKSGRKLDRAI